MTVGELKELLNDFDDDMPVAVEYTEYDGRYENDYVRDIEDTRIEKLYQTHAAGYWYPPVNQHHKMVLILSADI